MAYDQRDDHVATTKWTTKWQTERFQLDGARHSMHSRIAFRNEFASAVAAAPKLNPSDDPALASALAILRQRVNGDHGINPALHSGGPGTRSIETHSVAQAWKRPRGMGELLPGMPTSHKELRHPGAAMQLSYFKVCPDQRKPRDPTTEYCEHMFRARNLAKLFLNK